MKCAVVIPHKDIALLDLRKPDIFGSQDPGLDVVQERADRNHVVKDLRLFIRGRTKIELPCSKTVDLKSLFAGGWVKPDEGVLLDD